MNFSLEEIETMVKEYIAKQKPRPIKTHHLKISGFNYLDDLQVYRHYYDVHPSASVAKAMKKMGG